jgi:AcrR family transcriptional regulator
MGEAETRSRADRALGLELARRRFLARERIDVGAIASELGVNRTTLYRWFGGRDGLLGDLLHSLSKETFAWADARVDGEGIDRVIEILRLHITAVAHSEAFRHFLASEPQTAARVLFTDRGNVRSRTIDLVEEILLSERDALPGSVDPRVLAVALVRIGETFLYGDQIGSDEPDVEHHVAILELILR